MFVQVLQGRVSDPARVREQLENWVAEVAPQAEAWLGSTAGVTDDGQLVGVARFESEDAARHDSDRPEQGAWWEEMAALFTNEPVFHNSTEVELETHDDPSQAGFVQLMQGPTSDPARSRELMADTLSTGRPSGPTSLPRCTSPTRSTPGRWSTTSRRRQRPARGRRRRRRRSCRR